MSNPTARYRAAGWLLIPYRYFLSPLMHALGGAGSGCRFEPTCSHYAQEAISVHGWIRGFALALWRVLRCNPFSKSGTDPVPRAIARPSQGAS